jgi:hypothetical protein
MVAKISTGGNMFGALAYNQNKVDSEEAKVLFSNKMLLSEDAVPFCPPTTYFTAL